MRGLMLLFACSLVACGPSSEEGSPASDSATIDDAGPVETSSPDSATEDTAPSEASADAGVDLSKVNPIEGIGAADVKKLSTTAYGFTEGTTWNAGGFLLFSDIPNATIWKLVPEGTFTVFRAMSGNSNGLAWDPMGRLVACEHGNRRVSRSNADGSGVVTLADKYMGNELNSPNDAIVKSDGNIYFTDPDYGLEGRAAKLSFRGVFRIAPGGTLSLVDDAMNEPNGIALSPDEKTLYVGDTGSPVTNEFTVAADGTVSGKTKFVDTGSDGMAIDDAGNVYLSSGGIQVFKPNGEKWGTIPVPETPTNSAFGGPARTRLFISAGKSIYAVTLKIPGKG